ncbi:MAG: HesA/MoeB/ThiF family protein, partial [Gemmataceae bacterium]
QQLAAAGIGKIRLAHAGMVVPSDLNRQVLLSHADIGRYRVECSANRLRAFNPFLEIETIPENASPNNADRFVQGMDLVLSCAPLFAERLALNAAAVRFAIPLIDAAMFELELQLMVVLPGKTACLACLYPEEPPGWHRRFPVFGAVSGTVGCLAAMEAIKCLSGLGQGLAGQLLLADLRTMRFRRLALHRRQECQVCGHLGREEIHDQSV